MKTKLTVAVALVFFTLLGLDANARQSMGKLEIKAKRDYVVSTQNVLKVDTLIMHDKSAIVFNPDMHGVLETKVAIIGKDCFILSKGLDGGKRSINGQHGGNLTLQLNFLELGKLTIDTRGGNGRRGAEGRAGEPGTQTRTETVRYTDSQGKVHSYTVLHPGEPGTNGTNASPGGNAGDGGNILFTYSTSGFVPVFNQINIGKHSIIMLHKAGRHGIDGLPGRAQDLRNSSGTVMHNQNRQAVDGQIVLNNLNTMEEESQNLP